ncbi:PREDICTED: uncharacterized protein LOC106728262 [Myotis brandtii]|uniref:uncharacterized protein LOC106728262 n=1 Tax=Myotis brandtii TaxID=109478 RepID=UPI0007040256|nr:PREDICTED: uncharacterized protein LOC106728262 [Myotis brandtii]XP_014405488.1 PREDICTED: uncharacterized protein LOC106728262 [Myotis brandtii]
MVRKNGHSPGGRQVAWLSGTRRPGLLSFRARTRSELRLCACPSLSPGWWSHEQALFYPVASFMLTDAGGAARGGWGSGACALCPLHQPHLEQGCATPAPRRDSPDAEKALILAKCCFGTAVNCNLYSAAFDEGKEPTLMAPDRQGRAVKQRTICCLVSTGVCACVSAYTCTVVHSDVCMACACICVPSSVYDQVSAYVHTRVQGMCVRARWGGRRGMEEGGSGIYAFVKGRPTPRPPPATGLQALPRQLEPEGHRDPPLPALGLSPLHLSVSVPAPGGQHLSAALPRAGGAGPGPLLQASEGQGAPWLGRRSSAGWTPGPHPLNHEGTERRPGLKGGRSGPRGLNQCIGPDRPTPWSPGPEALP